mmetsp:Transcript_48535/g.96733  ORF Transcript_48535/g.96733 Transcript_48535/m.96733 type:complete len:212 (-) Transcript_48535:2254-2889(-)
MGLGGERQRRRSSVDRGSRSSSRASCKTAISASCKTVSNIDICARGAAADRRASSATTARHRRRCSLSKAYAVRGSGPCGRSHRQRSSHSGGRLQRARAYHHQGRPAPQRHQHVQASAHTCCARRLRCSGRVVTTPVAGWHGAARGGQRRGDNGPSVRHEQLEVRLADDDLIEGFVTHRDVADAVFAAGLAAELAAVVACGRHAERATRSL